MAGRPFPKIEIILKKFGNPKIISTFAIPIAEIAQLVEHDLAKVGVASSSLVFVSEVSIRHSFCFYRLNLYICFVAMLSTVKYGKT